jgi:hypothetical protein
MWPFPLILQFSLLGDLLYDFVTVLLIVFGVTSDYDVVTPSPLSVCEPAPVPPPLSVWEL